MISCLEQATWTLQKINYLETDEKKDNYIHFLSSNSKSWQN